LSLMARATSLVASMKYLMARTMNRPYSAGQLEEPAC
jgi:hypothetical protein